jgi:hypothetical protein
VGEEGLGADGLELDDRADGAAPLSRARGLAAQLVAVEVQRQAELERLDVAGRRGAAGRDDAPEAAAVGAVHRAGAPHQRRMEQAAECSPTRGSVPETLKDRDPRPARARTLGHHLAHRVADGLDDDRPDVAGAHRARRWMVGVQHRPDGPEVDLERPVEPSLIGRPGSKALISP